MSAASMNLCKWVTNSPDLRSKWEEEAMPCITEADSSGNVLKVLGLVWRPEKDDFKKNTKRSVLQTSARIFDPIGFLTLFTIRLKCLFQEIWQRGIGWDKQLAPDLTKLWNNWCSDPVIPIWYKIEFQPNAQSHKLHVFCDSSEKAYGAVVYLQGHNEDGEMVTSFVASKSQVAPLKKLTLPCMELMGALIGARLGNNLLKSLNMEKNQLRMWTDSMITLHWIRSTPQKWKPFVANRVTEIQ
ncbi:hypothetical protein N1851_018305 [Merluccius polli]|uniref:Uncharacterized protein n=1 Tax=Merluccius polli TaxID=89951 RepID=A0AA47MNY3_MERPO|nr:hypothetical protein N1851_018305 [Merluccius polli]